MKNLLTTHAIDNVWCEPTQDYQHVVRLARLTRDVGALIEVKVGWSWIKLPPQPPGGRKLYYHVYQIGQYPVELFDLRLDTGKWYRLDELMTSQSMFITLFLASGAVLPASKGYLQVTQSKNVIVAAGSFPEFDMGSRIEYDQYTNASSVVNNRLRNTDLFIRFYANALFDDIIWRSEINTATGRTDAENPIIYQQMTINEFADVQVARAMIRDLDDLNPETGGVLVYVDGYYFPKGLPTGLNYIGRSITAIYDDSFYQTPFDFVIRDLSVFVSEIDDNIEKYILVTDNEYDQIDYFDDIDVFIIPPENGTTVESVRGVMVPITKPSHFRNLTHNTYAISTDLIHDTIVQNLSLDSFDLKDLSIRLMIRRGGKVNGMTNQYNRIEELYNLPKDRILSTLTGVNSVMDIWKASNLERSAYINLLSADFTQITPQLVEEAYGYNYATELMVPPIHDVVTIGSGETEQRIINVEPAFALRDPRKESGSRCVFVYREGKLLDYFNDSFQSDIITIPETITDDISHTEVFQGEVSEDYDGVLYDQDIKRADLGFYGFRAYVSTLTLNGPSEDWVDVTDTAYYTYYPKGSNGDGIAEIVWDWSLLNNADLYPAVKINKYIHLYRPQLTDNSGELAFRSVDGMILVALKTRVTWFNTQQVRVQTLPPATLDVFLNGENLIEGIDYHVDWPYVCIVNRFGTNLSDTDILMRTYGCGDPTLKRSFPPREVGFVRDGMLSSNGRYDPKNARPIRIVSEGRIFKKSEVSFIERSNSNLITDGRPYSISDYILPVESFTTQTTTPYRLSAVAIDQSVTNYVSQFLPEPPALNPYIDSFKWEVYSPVCALLLHMFENDYLMEETKVKWNGTQVEAWLQPVKHLFKYDPAKLGVNDDFVDIFTTGRTEEISIYRGQYELLNYVIRKYLNDQVNLSDQITIKPYPQV